MKENWLIKIGTKLCPVCGKGFNIFSNKPSKKYCSKKCGRRQWYLNHKEHENNYANNWYFKNRESEILKNKEYREKNKALFSWYHSKDRFGGLRDDVLKRDNHTCIGCGSTEDLAIHHKDGRGYTLFKKGANNAPDNLVTLCRICHKKLHHYQKRMNVVILDNHKITEIITLLNKHHEARKKRCDRRHAHTLS